MSYEQIDALMSEEKAKKNEERIRNQIAAVKELQEAFAGKGAAWAVTGEDDKIDDVIAKYKLLPEYAEQIKEKIGSTTNLSEYFSQLADSTNKDLQNFLKGEAETGIVEGMKKGFSNPDVQAGVSKLMSDYSAAIEKSNAETEKKISEAYARIARIRSGAEKTSNSTEKANLIKNLNSQIESLQAKLEEARGDIGKTFGTELSKYVNDAQEKVDGLEKKVASATGEKKLSLMAELKSARDERDTLQSIMKLVEAGRKDVDLVINVVRNTENAEIGNDALIKIGESYKEVDDQAQKVIDSITDTVDEYEKLGDKSTVTLKDMLEKAGMTADGIDHSFDTSIGNVKKDIDDLRKKLADAKDENEKRKINIQIARKEETLTYIETLKARLKAMAENPYNVKINLFTNYDKNDSFFKRVGGIFNNISQRAQQEGQQAQEEENTKNDTEERKTAAEWKKEQRQFLQGRKKELEALLKTKLTQKEAEDYQKEIDQINSTLKKGAAAGKKLLEQRAKRVADELKYRDDMEKMRREAERARRDAEIAAEPNDDIRERLTREEQYRRKLEDIELQQNDTFRKIYQERKQLYEQQHQGMKYELTTEGAKGWWGVREEAMPNTLQNKAMDAAADKLRKIGFSEQQIQSLKDGKASIEDVSNAIAKLDDKQRTEIGIDVNTDKAEKNVKAFKDYLQGDIAKGAKIAERNILEIAGKGDIIRKIDLEFSSGNVDAVARPMVDAAELVKKGWKEAGDAIQSVMVKDSKGEEHRILLYYQSKTLTSM